MNDEELLKFVEEFKEYLLDTAPYCCAYDYANRRKELIKNCIYREFIPEFIKKHRTNKELFEFLKENYMLAKDARKYIGQEFALLLEKLEEIVLIGSKETMVPLDLTNLPNIMREGMKTNQEIYPIVFYVENFMRLYVSIKYYERFKNYSLKNFLEKCAKAKRTYEKNKQDEDKYSWLKERGELPVFYLDFIDLKYIILSNWDAFERDFPDQAFINTKFDQFYKIRCKGAHNSNTVLEEEIRILNDDAYILTKQLKKYNSKIKKFKLNNLDEYTE